MGVEAFLFTTGDIVQSMRLSQHIDTDPINEEIRTTRPINKIYYINIHLVIIYALADL